MPSVQLTNQSGGQLIISGNFVSEFNRPQGQIVFRADSANSGSVYIGLSGGVTVKSGGYPLSGGIYSGSLDGMPLAAGDVYAVPNLGIANKGALSGTFNIYAATDAAASGFARLFFEIY